MVRCGCWSRHHHVALIAIICNQLFTCRTIHSSPRMGWCDTAEVAGATPLEVPVGGRGLKVVSLKKSSVRPPRYYRTAEVLGDYGTILRITYRWYGKQG